MNKQRTTLQEKLRIIATYQHITRKKTLYQIPCHLMTTRKIIWIFRSTLNAHIRLTLIQTRPRCHIAKESSLHRTPTLQGILTIRSSKDRTFNPIMYLIYFSSFVYLALNLVSINSQGLRSFNRRQNVFNLIKKHKYDIIFLQETHWTAELQTDILREWARTDSPTPFEWSNTSLPHKLLGLYVENIDCTNQNLESKIHKLRNITAAWRHHDLSLKGRALVINGLLTSTLWYLATNFHFPAWAVQEIEDIVYSFLWDHKRPLLNRDVLSLPIAEGGLNLCRITDNIHALPLNTLKRLLTPDKAFWKIFTSHFLRLTHMPLGKYTLALNYTLHHIDRHIPPFHRDLLTAWHTHADYRQRIHPPITLPDILKEPLFHNALISANNAPLLHSDWIKAGVLSIENICYSVIPGFLPPHFNTTFWKTIYPKLATNKQGDVNWKITHHILPTALSLHRAAVYNTPHCPHCQTIENTEHLFIHCQFTQTFWTNIQNYINKMTHSTLRLTDNIKLFGLTRHNTTIHNTDTLNLLNWTLTIARCAIHKSAVEYRTKQIHTSPDDLFLASVKTHLKLQHKCYTMQNKENDFISIWGIGSALASINNHKLIFHL